MSTPAENILSSLGFTESETKTYLAGLAGGPQTVLDIVKRTGFSRQTTYEAIEGLKRRGLMTTSQRGKKTFYASEHPQRLITYAKRQESEMNEIVQTLESSVVPKLEAHMGGERPVVKLFEGKEGIYAIIEELRASGMQELYEVVDGDAMLKVITDKDLIPFRNELRRLRTKTRSIISGNFRPAPKGIPVSRKVLPRSEGGFKTNVEITKDLVCFVTFAGRMHSVSIRDPNIAKTMRMLFRYARKGIGGPDR